MLRSCLSSPAILILQKVTHNHRYVISALSQSLVLAQMLVVLRYDSSKAFRRRPWLVCSSNSSLGKSDSARVIYEHMHVVWSY